MPRTGSDRRPTPRLLIEALEALKAQYGAKPLRERRRLIAELEWRPIESPALLVRYHDLLLFLRAYPDDAAALATASAALARMPERVGAILNQVSTRATIGEALPAGLLDSGLPDTWNVHSYSLSMLRDLHREYGSDLEIAWEQVEDSGPLFETMAQCLHYAETPGIDDERIDADEWLALARGGREATDLDLLLQLIEGSPHPEELRAQLYDGLELPVRWRLRKPGAAKATALRTPSPAFHHPGPLEREAPPLADHLRQRLPSPRRLSPAQADEAILWMKSAMSVRNRELFPLCHPEARDSWVIELERGLSLYVFGVEARWRLLLECLYGQFFVKNGVPVGYALSSAFAGASEVGLNIYETFRQGENALLYAELLRTLHHLFEIEYFFVPRRQFGYDNEEGIASGAYWFYDKLGFRSVDPDLRGLADEERELKRGHPKHRTSPRVLRKLAEEDVYFSLRPDFGPEQVVPYGRVSMAVTHWITERFEGNRREAQEWALKEAMRRLDLTAAGGEAPTGWTAEEREALTRLAPLVALIPDWESWRKDERALLRRMVRAKGGVAEREYALLTRQHSRWSEILQSLAPPGSENQLSSAP